MLRKQQNVLLHLKVGRGEGGLIFVAIWSGEAPSMHRGIRFFPAV